MVTETSGNGYVLYNGVKLLKIDSVWTDKVTYPNATLGATDGEDIGTTGVMYALHLCANQGEATDGVVNIPHGYYQQYMLVTSQELADLLSQVMGVNITPNEWVDVALDSEGEITGLNSIFWANYDVLNEDGSVFLSASDPIPLDGMTVIEWDGDTTGLASIEQGLTWYKVADSIGTELSVLGYIGDDEKFVYYGESLSEIIQTDPTGSVAYSMYAGEFTQEYIDSAGLDATPGLYFIKVNPDVDNYYTYLAAYTPATTEPDEPEPEAPTHDPTSMLLGWLTGERVKAMLRKPQDKVPVAYLYNGVRLPTLPEWDKTVYPYAFMFKTVGFITGYNRKERNNE